MITPLAHVHPERTPHPRPPYAPRDPVRCILCCLAVRVVRGGREARPDQAASRARPEPAGPLSLTEVSPSPSLFPGALLSPLCPVTACGLRRSGSPPSACWTASAPQPCRRHLPSSRMPCQTRRTTRCALHVIATLGPSLIDG
eukprot:scaffold44848_cov66-Phaeocystis_antarctica.AAC.11